MSPVAFGKSVESATPAAILLQYSFFHNQWKSKRTTHSNYKKGMPRVCGKNSDSSDTGSF
jgi:hypothetical protein